MAQGPIDIYTTPPMEAPDGMESNLIDPYTKQPYLIAGAAVCLTLTSTAIVARTFTRFSILKQMALDDFALILSGLFFGAFAGGMLVSGEYGQGSHMWDVSIAGLMKVLEWANIIEILYGPAMFFAKYAVLVQIERIFLNHSPKSFARVMIQILIWANLIFYSGIFFSFIFACWPREKIWNTEIPGRCIDSMAAIVATSAINVVSDVTILAVPIAGVWQLQMPLKRKIGAGAVFAVGILACVTSIVRLYYSVKLTKTDDVTWEIEPVGGWALGEFTSVILCACFPTLPRFFKYLAGKDMNSTSYGKSSGAQSTGRSWRSRVKTASVTTSDIGLYERPNVNERAPTGPFVQLGNVTDVERGS